MERIRLSPLPVLVLLLTLTLTAAPGDDFERYQEWAEAASRRVLRLTNTRRMAAGLAPLTWNPLLARAAQGHAYEMARLERLGHRLHGESAGDRMEAAGYRWLRWGENVFAGWGRGANTPLAAVSWWMESPAHRDNLLSAHFTELGVGIWSGQDGKTYYCQVFGLPR